MALMRWSVTEDAATFLAESGDFLRATAAEHTVVLTVAESIRARGAAALGGAATLFGWCRSTDGHVRGVFLHSPGGPVYLGAIPPEAIGPLANYRS